MHILITDDLFTNRFQIGLVLKSMGFTYDMATNGDQAIEMIMKNHYDLVLMDIEMPVRNGIETVQYIRQKMDGIKRNLPVIAVTAHDPSDYSDNFFKLGFTGWISKPVTEKKINSILINLKYKGALPE
jgi:two-component system, response regulator, stage 0 sporulation protein F